jgi:hypothetical protein
MVMQCTPHNSAYWAFNHQLLLEAKGVPCKLGRIVGMWYVIHG